MVTKPNRTDRPWSDAARCRRRAPRARRPSMRPSAGPPNRWPADPRKAQMRSPLVDRCASWLLDEISALRTFGIRGRQCSMERALPCMAFELESSVGHDSSIPLQAVHMQSFCAMQNFRSNEQERRQIMLHCVGRSVFPASFGIIEPISAWHDPCCQAAPGSRQSRPAAKLPNGGQASRTSRFHGELMAVRIRNSPAAPLR